MGDAFTGASTREETFALREEVTQILQTADLRIRQWASNDPYLLRDLSTDAIVTATLSPKLSKYYTRRHQLSPKSTHGPTTSLVYKT